MPRKRMLDPSFWSDADVGLLSRDERLFFLGLVSHSDDEGRGEASPEFLRRAIFGYDSDVTVQMVDEWLKDIAAKIRGLVLYDVGKRRYFWLSHWRRYQKVNRPTPSCLPPPPVREEETERVQLEVDPEYGQMVKAWEAAVGLLNTAHLLELENLVQDWDENNVRLPEGHKNRDVSGPQAVTAAIQETVLHADRPTLAYLKAIMKSWIQNGYQAPKPASKKTLPPAEPGLSKAELAKARKNAR